MQGNEAEYGKETDDRPRYGIVEPGLLKSYMPGGLASMMDLKVHRHPSGTTVPGLLKITYGLPV